jgi:hypothetical protein
VSRSGQRAKGQRERRWAVNRTLLARLAAHERWARVSDRSAATAAARSAADDRFIAEARRLHPSLSEDEVRKRARNLRSAHALRAARARWHGPHDKVRAAIDGALDG